MTRVRKIMYNTRPGSKIWLPTSKNRLSGNGDKESTRHLPDSMSSCGLLMAPADSTTSRRASAVRFRPSRSNSTPYARLLSGSMSTRVTCDHRATCRFRRSRIGCKNALDVLHRYPRRIVNWYSPYPVWISLFVSRIS